LMALTSRVTTWLGRAPGTMARRRTGIGAR
jgi:hypothetical protein